MEALKNAHANLVALEARHDLVNGPTALAEATRALAKAAAEVLIGKPKTRATPRRAKPATKPKGKR